MLKLSPQLNETEFANAVVNITSNAAKMDASALIVCGTIVSNFTLTAIENITVSKKYITLHRFLYIT